MISDPQTPPIFAQSANIEPFPQVASYPGDAVVQGGAMLPGQQGMLQRSAPPWMQGRQMLPPAQPPRPQYQPQMQMPQQNPYGGGMPPWMQQQSYGPPPWMQQQQGPPPWMQQAPPWMQGGGGMGYGGGGWGGPPPWMQRRQMMQQNPYQLQMPTAPYMPQQNPYQAQQPAQPAQQVVRPAFNPSAPQYNAQAVRPQPAGQVNAPPPQVAPPMQPNRAAAITPTPIYNRGNELA
jgi:hypothetical protein